MTAVQQPFSRHYICKYPPFCMVPQMLCNESVCGARVPTMAPPWPSQVWCHNMAVRVLSAIPSSVHAFLNIGSHTDQQWNKKCKPTTADFVEMLVRDFQLYTCIHTRCELSPLSLLVHKWKRFMSHGCVMTDWCLASPPVVCQLEVIKRISVGMHSSSSVNLWRKLMMWEVNVLLL